MKTRQLTVVASAFVVASILAPGLAHAQASATLTAPIGTLSANTSLGRVGTNPMLNWNIIYPSTVIDHVKVDTSSVTPKVKLDVEIRALGAGVTTSGSSGSSPTFVPTEAMFSYAGASYQRIFYGTNKDVNPTKVVYSGTVDPGKPLCFGGRYYYNRGWSTFYTSTGGTKNVRTLVNGDKPPTFYPLYNAPTLESFLKPYLDGSGRVAIGPMDVIVFMELTHTDAQVTQSGYDCQDMVLLVTFKTRK